jgi:5'-nucleotidase/UDP-sugar diphosphatase
MSENTLSPCMRQQFVDELKNSNFPHPGYKICPMRSCKEVHIRKLVIFCFSLVLFFLSACNVCAGQSVIRILYMNDFHGFAEPYKSPGSDELLGGISYLAAKVDKLRDEKPSLLLAAGDMIEGNIWANLFQGQSVIDLMNEMRFDAMVAGNHEFDFGQDVLRKRISEAKFPVLGANVEGLDALKPYVIKKTAGIKIAIIGVVTDETPIATNPRNVAGLRFLSPEKTVRKYIGELKNRADIIIVVSHIGYHADRALAERVKGVDLIVGGHSHTEILSPVVVGRTIIVQAWEHAKALGVLDLTVEDRRIVKFDGHLELIEPDGEDAHVGAVVAEYEGRIDRHLNTVIGNTCADLDGENASRRETNFGDLITDIIRDAAGADIAIINGGSIRANIAKGGIRARDIYAALPFDNYVVAVRLTGKQIREALEHGVSATERGPGRFPQVSGMRFAYSGAAQAGSRVREISIAGKPIEPEKEYTVATNDFLAAGGDGYRVFKEAVESSGDFSITDGVMKSGTIVHNDYGRQLRDLVINYIKEKKNICPSHGWRITEIR